MPSPLFVHCPFHLVLLPVSVCAAGGGGSRGALCAVPAACPCPAVLCVLRGSVHLLWGGSAVTMCAFLKGL